MSMQSSVQTITPSYAKYLLESNTINRSPSSKTIEKYSRDMMSGNWDSNGSAITLAEDGTLVDGQHRLMACIKANTPFETIVVTGVDKGAFKTVDCGRKRSVADVLKIKGYKHYSTLSAITLRVLNAKRLGVEDAFNRYKALFSVSEIVEAVEHDDGLIAAATFAGSHNGVLRNIGITQAVAGTLFYLFSEASDAETCEEFFGELIDLSTTSKKPSIAAGQAALIKNVSVMATRGGVGYSAKWVAAVVIKTWNKWLRGEDVKQIKFVPGGSNPEKFPTIESPLFN